MLVRHPSLLFFSLPPSCFLPGLKVDVEKLEQNIPCCKASDALASIILGGGRGWGSRECAVGILGALIFFFLFPWSCRHGEPHEEHTHLHTHTHTSQLWEHGANSSGTEATKNWGFIVEITTGSLHEEFLLFFFSVLSAGRTVVLFSSSGSPPRGRWRRRRSLRIWAVCCFVLAIGHLGARADSGRSAV